MSECSRPFCPRCGSTQLFSSSGSRKVFIDHKGERIPLLTANYSLALPVIEDRVTTYTCACTWTWTEDNLHTQM